MEIFGTCEKNKKEKNEKKTKVTPQILSKQWLYSNDYEYLGILIFLRNNSLSCFLKRRNQAYCNITYSSDGFLPSRITYLSNFSSCSEFA